MVKNDRPFRDLTKSSGFAKLKSLSLSADILYNLYIYCIYKHICIHIYMCVSILGRFDSHAKGLAMIDFFFSPFLAFLRSSVVETAGSILVAHPTIERLPLSLFTFVAHPRTPNIKSYETAGWENPGFAQDAPILTARRYRIM